MTGRRPASRRASRTVSGSSSRPAAANAWATGGSIHRPPPARWRAAAGGAPSNAMRPASITTTRSASANSRPVRCSASTTVTPRSRLMRVTSASSSSAATGSSWLVGSSSSSSGCPIASTDAMAIRWPSPPDSVAGVALGQVRGAGGHQRLLGAGGDRGWRMGDALQPERHLVAHPLGDQLRLGILEHQPGVAGQLARPVVARVQAVDHHAAGQLAAVEVRHQAERGPQQRRLAAARLADDQHQLARLDVQRDAVQRGLRGRRVGVADVHEAQRGHRTAPMATAVSAANAADPPIAAAVTGSPSRS